MIKEKIRNWLGVSGKKKVDNLENRIEDLESLRDNLTDSVLDDKPQLQFILQELESESLDKKTVVEKVEDKFDVSRATAYRRINELENEYQLIRTNDKGLLERISFSSHEIQLDEN